MTAARHRLRLVYLSVQGMDQTQGAATHVRAVVDGLARHHDVVLCAPRASDSRSVLGRLISLVRVSSAGVRKSRSADVVYIRHHPLLAPVAAVLRRLGRPVVEELNGPLEDFSAAHPVLTPVMWVLRRLSIYSLARADGVVAVSTQLRTYLIAGGVASARIHVIPNGADLEAFTPGVPADPAYALFFGALTPWQGLETLARATRRPEWPQDLPLHVVGSGTSESDLDGGDPALIRRLGTVPHDRMPAVVSGARFTISPKTPAARFSSPLKLYESLACGVPTIVTDVGEQGRIVRDLDCGVVIPDNDPAALARAVADLSGDPARRAQMAASALAQRETMGWDDRLRTIDDLLHELANEPHGNADGVEAAG